MTGGYYGRRDLVLPARAMPGSKRRKVNLIAIACQKR
jgi:hypothetical protein